MEPDPSARFIRLQVAAPAVASRTQGMAVERLAKLLVPGTSRVLQLAGTLHKPGFVPGAHEVVTTCAWVFKASSDLAIMHATTVLLTGRKGFIAESFNGWGAGIDPGPPGRSEEHTS